MAERIQLSRAKGWRMPDNTVKVSRPGKFGNPFKGEDGASTGARETLVLAFREWLTVPTHWTTQGEASPSGCLHWLYVPLSDRNKVLESLAELRGKNLACWCPLSQPCHADVLLELANASALGAMDGGKKP